MKQHRLLTTLLVVMLLWATSEVTLRLFFAPPRWTPPELPNTDELYRELHGVKFYDGGPADYSSPLVNVRDGERVTTGQSASAHHDLYVFGSSTVFGWENDDAGTLPSELQKLLPSYHLHNRGVVGDTTLLMTSRLKQVKLKPGDMVLFVDGGLEGINISRDIQVHFGPCDYMNANARDILTGRAFCSLFDSASIQAMRSGAQPVINDTVEHYRHAVLAAQQYAARAGADFYNIIQPYFASTPPTPEEEVAVHFDLLYAGYGALYSRLDTQYATVLPDRTFDLSHSVDKARQSGVTLYGDPDHLNDAGNAILAQAIYREIWQKF